MIPLWRTTHLAHAVLDQIGEMVFVYDRARKLIYANRLGEAARHSFEPDDLPRALAERLSETAWRLDGPDVPFAFLTSSGKRIQLYYSTRALRLGRRTYAVCLVRRSPSVSTLVRQRDSAQAQLRTSRAAALNVMEDLLIQKEELEGYRKHLEVLVEERTKALVAIQERARQSERLASLGALAAGIAHEINNPIGAMMLSAQNTLEVSEELTTIEALRSELKRFADKVVLHSKRCGIIVRGVLQFARKQKSERSWTNLNSVVESGIGILRESMELKDCDFELHLDPDLPAVWMNDLEFEQIVVNLVKNACESDTKGPVQVITERTKTHARLRVADSGRGMGPEEVKHIFDPFFTTRQQRGGTGLGLSIVHGIVSNYEGTINVQSKPGEGTVVTIEVPLASPAAQAETQAHPSLT